MRATEPLFCITPLPSGIPGVGYELPGGLEPVELRQDLVVGREIFLISPDERISNAPRSVDEEQRRSRDIPGIQANRVPDTVGLDYLTGLIHQDVEGKTAIFHVAAHHFGALRDDGDDLDPAIFVVFRVICQFTEPATAVRSPGAAMKREQHRASSQEAFQRATLSLLCR